jgi:NAD(P)H-hydrate epimerase
MTRPIFVLTAAEMRAADECAVEAGTTVETLMERAGEGAVEAIERHFGTQRGFRTVVVCGKGNNGGDGLVVARLLAKRGTKVEVVLLAPAAELRGATAANLGRLAEAGLTADADLSALERADLAVDAMLGTGATGPLAAPYASAVRAVRAARGRGAKVVALDLPTGLSADTGRLAAESDEAIEADLTVTFAHRKPVHVLYPGRAHCGTVEVVDIGVEPSTATVEYATPDWAARTVPRRKPTAHKGDAGRVFLVGGSVGLTGAIVLASKSALRAGAGLVTAGVPESVNDAIEAAMTEPMTLPLPESPERALTPEALPLVVARAREAQCVALGPGLSRTPESGELARAVVDQATTTVVLDADGLYAFAGEQAARFAARHGHAALIVTPHLGELSRLTGRPAAELEADRLAAPRAYARQWNAIVVMKGAPTVTAAPDGRMTVNSTGNPGMATAGMGDVLTGVIAGFVAQGLDPYDAARLGVYVHGLAADVAQSRVGTLSLIAGDVIHALPEVLSDLEGRR